jgi:hypothetical protein
MADPHALGVVSSIEAIQGKDDYIAVQHKTSLYWRGNGIKTLFIIS